MKSIFFNVIFLISLYEIRAFDSVTVKDCVFLDQKMMKKMQIFCEKSSYYRIDNCNFMIFRSMFMSDYREKITHLKLTGCNNDFLRSKAYGSFENLRELDISDLNISTLVPSTLPKGILVLNASFNELTQVELGIFEQSKNLVEINFSHNRIKQLTTESICMGNQIAVLNFSFNEIFDVELATFFSLINLNILDLSNNKIKFLHEDTFIFNDNLILLNLKENPIQRFDGNVFVPIIYSAIVSVSCNHVKVLDTSSVLGGLDIDIFNENEVIFQIKGKTELRCGLSDLSRLVYLNISGLQLRNAPKILNLLDWPMEYVDVSGNFLDLFDNIENDYDKPNYYDRDGFYHIYVEPLNNVVQQKRNKYFVIFTIIRDYEDFYDDNDDNDYLIKNYTKHLPSRNFEEKNKSIDKSELPMLSTMGLSRSFFPCGYLKRFMHKGDYENIIRNLTNGRNIDCYHDDNMTTVVFHRNRPNQSIPDEENAIVLNSKKVSHKKQMQNILKKNQNIFDFTGHLIQNQRNASSNRNKKAGSHNTLNENEYRASNSAENETTFESIASTFATKNTSEITTDLEQWQLQGKDEENSTEAKAELTTLVNPPKPSNSSSNFWFQLQILQFILVIFSLLYLLIKFTKKFTKDFNSTNIIESNPKGKNDNFHIIELEKHNQKNTQNIYVTIS